MGESGLDVEIPRLPSASPFDPSTGLRAGSAQDKLLQSLGMTAAE